MKIVKIKTNRRLIMREIKFRGKSSTYKEWKYGTPVNLEQDTIIIEERGVFNDGSASPFFSKWDFVMSDSIGQYTGLKDKNGKEIYEGDLIKAPSGRIYSVIFSTWEHEEKRKFPKVIDLYEHTGWCISLDGVNPCDLLDSEVCQGCIIGNVFDNPELQQGGLHKK